MLITTTEWYCTECSMVAEAGSEYSAELAYNKHKDSGECTNMQEAT